MDVMRKQYIAEWLSAAWDCELVATDAVRPCPYDYRAYRDGRVVAIVIITRQAEAASATELLLDGDLKPRLNDAAHALGAQAAIVVWDLPAELRWFDALKMPPLAVTNHAYRIPLAATGRLELGSPEELRAVRVVRDTMGGRVISTA